MGGRKLSVTPTCSWEHKLDSDPEVVEQARRDVLHALSCGAQYVVWHWWKAPESIRKACWCRCGDEDWVVATTSDYVEWIDALDVSERNADTYDLGGGVTVYIGGHCP